MTGITTTSESRPILSVKNYEAIRTDIEALNTELKTITASTAELNLLDNAVAGTVVNSKVVVYDAAGKVITSSATIVADGTVIGDAVALTAQNNIVTGADGSKGVILPVAVVNAEVTVINSNAAADLLVYPITGSQINALGASNPFTVTSGQTATFIARSTTLWYTAGMPNTVAGLTASGAELNYNDITALGTVEASKTVTVDANKDVSAFRTVGVVNLDAGSSGVAGTVDVFPTTAANGKLAITCTNQGSDITSTLNLAAQTQANTISIPDVNAAASNVVLSTNALTLAQVDKLETIAATAAEINKAADLSAQVEVITTAGAQAITAGVQAVYLNEATTAITATIATAVAHQGLFLIKAGLEPNAGQDHTCTLTIGTWNGTNNIATFADIDDFLLVYFDAAGAGTILVNNGAVALS